MRPTGDESVDAPSSGSGGRMVGTGLEIEHIVASLKFNFWQVLGPGFLFHTRFLFYSAV